MDQSIETLPQALEISPEVVDLLAQVQARLAEVERRERDLEAQEAERQRIAMELADAEAIVISVVEDVSVNHPTDTEAILASKLQAEKAPLPFSHSNNGNPGDNLPDNLPAYVLAASLGIAIVIAQTVFHRLSVKRA